MALEQNVTRIEGAKQDLKSAIEEKGVSVPSTMKIDGYADLVRNIKNQSNISSVDKSINVRISVDGDVDLAVNTEIIATNDSVDEKVAKHYTKIETDNKFQTIAGMKDYYTKTQSDETFVSNLTSEDDSVKFTRTTSGYDLSIGEVNGVTFGYLINGSFYTQNEENEEYKIEPQMERLYVDILTNDSYEYTTVKKEDVEVKTLSNGKFGNISNAKVGNYAYYKDFYSSEYNIENDEIIYQIDKEFIEDTFTNFIPKGTHILNFSDITYLCAKYNISNINEEADKFINALTKDFDFKFTTINVGVDKIEDSFFWVVLDEESKEELGINDDVMLFNIYHPSTSSYMVNSYPYTYEDLTDETIGSLYYVLDSYTSQPIVDNDLKCLDVPYEGAVTLAEYIENTYIATDFEGGTSLCYPYEAINVVLPQGTHILTLDELSTFVLDRYPNFYDIGGDERYLALYNTFIDIGIEKMTCKLYGINTTLLQFYLYDESERTIYPMLLQISDDFKFWGENQMPSQIYYLYDNGQSVVEDDMNKFINKYVKVGDTKVQNGQFINEMFMDKNNNKLDLINDKLYFDNEKKITYVYENGELIPLGGSSIVNINYIQSLVDRIVALENALKANNINI